MSDKELGSREPPALGDAPLPAGWQWRTLGEVTEINPRRPPRLYLPGESLVSYLPMQGIDEVRGTIEALAVRPLSEVAKGFTFFREGDVLFAKITPSMQNGKCAIATGLIHGIGFGSTEFHVFRPKQNVLPGWLHIYLRRLSFRREAMSHFQGAVGQQRVPEDFLRSVLIPVPGSLTVQRQLLERVSSYMTEIGEAREYLARINADTARVLPAALAEIFSPGTTPRISRQRVVKPLHEVATLSRGRFSARPRNDPKFFGGSMPWVQIQNLPGDFNKYIIDSMDTLNPEGVAVSRVFPKGTLVISIAATIGALGILNMEACFPDSLVGINPDPAQLDTGFLFWQLRYQRVELERNAPGATLRNINLRTLNELKIWLPSRSEQRSIDAHLDDLITNLRQIHQSYVGDTALLGQLEQSILERAIHGEL